MERQSSVFYAAGSELATNNGHQSAWLNEFYYRSSIKKRGTRLVPATAGRQRRE